MAVPANKVSAAGPGRKRVLAVIGTRPEAIKMAPVIRALRHADWTEVRVLATGQHRDMLDQALGVFGIVPDVDLNIMRSGQSLSELTSRLLPAVDGVLARERPDAVLVQGDTTTVMATALAAFYRRIPVGHVEAGLRSGDMGNPFPEEMNRVVVARLSRWHFAPTDTARNDLLREGIPSEQIHVTGNTVIDALTETAAREDLPLVERVPLDARVVLVTAHRRENFGAPLAEICRAVRLLVERYPDVYVLYPVHPNPNVATVVHELLGGHSRIVLTEPLDYLPFVSAMKRSALILTDSGGVQEEAPALGKPVLVMRDRTERPEAVRDGLAKLVGTRCDEIVASAGMLLDDPAEYAAMSRGASPYGDGKAGERIASLLGIDLGRTSTVREGGPNAAR